MNVNVARHRVSVLTRIFRLWPLWSFLFLLGLGIRWAVVYWPQILLQSTIWQKSLHQQMSSLLQMVEAQPHQAGLSLMAFSLAYGVLHAVGPGHGKVVIMTYLATHPSRLKSSLRLTFSASLVQGLMAVLLVSVVLGMLQLSSKTLHISSFWLEKGSFILVAGVGGLLCYRAIKQLCSRVWLDKPKPITILSVRSISPSGFSNIPRVSKTFVSDHQHDEHCGCGHRHLPSNEELNRDTHWRTRLMIVFAMGMRPCSGAILVLLFSKVIGVYSWGIASALVMALGTALTISLLAMLVFYCRRLIERLSRSGTSSTWQRVVWPLLSLAGGVMLFGTGVLFYLSAEPSMMGGIRPFSG